MGRSITFSRVRMCHMRNAKITRTERSFCVFLLLALAIGTGLYLAISLANQHIAEDNLAKATTIIQPYQTARVMGNDDGSDGMPWSGEMEIRVVNSVLYPSLVNARQSCNLGNIANEGQSEDDPYLVVDLLLSNINAEARAAFMDASQNVVRRNGVNASIFMLEGDDGSYLPLSVNTNRESLSTWTFLLDEGEEAALRLGYSVPRTDMLSSPYVYIVTPLWRLQIDISNAKEVQNA